MAKHRARVAAAHAGQLPPNKPGKCGCSAVAQTYRWLGMEFYKHCHCVVRLKDWCMETNWRNRNPKDGPIKSALKALTA